MFSVGQSYVFRTVGYHWIGLVAEIDGRWLRLQQASWLADTGRYHDLVSTPVERIPGSEIEHVGDAILNADHVTDAIPYRHTLPTESK